MLLFWVETKAKYEEKMILLPQELDNMRKNEISEREDNWNSHITGLIEDHNKTFRDAKEQVSVMQQDLEVSKSLKVKVHTFNILVKISTVKFQLFYLGLHVMIISITHESSD